MYATLLLCLLSCWGIYVIISSSEYLCEEHLGELFRWCAEATSVHPSELAKPVVLRHRLGDSGASR